MQCANEYNYDRQSYFNYLHIIYMEFYGWENAEKDSTDFLFTLQLNYRIKVPFYLGWSVLLVEEEMHGGSWSILSLLKLL